MDDRDMKKMVMNALEKGNGILRLRPTWVARDFLKPLGRLGLAESEYDLGNGRYIVERWFGSETRADNPNGPKDEGLSYIDIKEKDILLRDAIRTCSSEIMGKVYAQNHKNLGRLAKLYDVDTRISFHYHQMQRDADLVGKTSKEEAYYFPEGVEQGLHPESFFGVHPYIVDQQKQEDLLLPHLIAWNSDLILKHSRAYLQVLGEGMHLPSGVLHAPGTALTLELQENSDVFSMMQAVVDGRRLSKELLFKDIRKEDREKYGERVVFGQIDWNICGDPYFYENRNTPPIMINETKGAEGYEDWIYYNTMKFSGKKTTVKPGSSFISRDRGVYNVYVWQGSGRIDGHAIEAKDFEMDEVLVSHGKAVEGIPIENTGKTDLIIFKFFGPDINDDVPFIERYPKN